MEIPEEITSSLPLISILGQKRVQIENYQSICAFSQKEIICVTKAGRVRIVGNQLLILAYTPRILQIEGEISSIIFKDD